MIRLYVGFVSPVIRMYNFPGDHSEEVTPVPIPNTEVKLLSGDGIMG